MTDNEIITNLELFAILVCETDAQKETVCSAIDLIKRLQAQNDRDVKVKVEALYKVNDLKIENERQQAEIERLQMMIDSDNEVCTECHCEYMDKVHQARIEAIKEFARRLKSKAKDEFMYDYKMLTMATEFVVVKEIDNLVKEMVGEE